MNEGLLARIAESAKFITSQLKNLPVPQTLVTLGSGFAGFQDKLNVSLKIDLKDIPHVKTPQVHGHGASLVFGSIANQQVAVQTGRVHLYEGYSADDIVFTTRVMAKVGIRNLVVTNAAGGLHAGLKPGDVLMLRDQVNLTGTNCLVGVPSELGQRFVDMINCYDRDWRAAVVKETGVKEGVYIGLLGPTYETPAETALFASFKADAVGMSTVQEVIAARQLGLRVAGFSFVTNLAAGLSSSVSHLEVLDIGKKKTSYLQEIIVKTINALNDL
jgi:purine-nucleoside phosphorylase